MRAEFDEQGRIILTPEEPVEQFALRRWAGALRPLAIHEETGERLDAYPANGLILNHVSFTDTSSRPRMINTLSYRGNERRHSARRGGSE